MFRPTVTMLAAVAVLLLCLSSPVQAASTFLIGLPPARADAHQQLERLFWQISDPQSPEYLNFRSVEQVADLIGSAPDTITHTIQWLRDEGVHDVELLRTRDLLRVRVPSDHHVLTRLARANHYRNPVATGLVGSARGAPLRTPAALAAKGVQLSFVVRVSDSANPSGLDRGLFGRVRPQTAQTTAPMTLGTVEAIKNAYGIPLDQQATHPDSIQMVWGPGTFGVDKNGDLRNFKNQFVPQLNLSRVQYDQSFEGTPGGDNFGEGTLDTEMISAFGLGALTLVSNTNQSSSTEEGDGFGQALLDFATGLAARTRQVPNILSMSLGSLSWTSCNLLCAKAAAAGGFSYQDCYAYMQTQRQVCMFLTDEEVTRTNVAFQTLGVRGISLFGATGDGGSHFSFQPFDPLNKIGSALNDVSCAYSIPTFPAASPFVTGVGGSSWTFASPSDPVAWSGSGSGFSWQFPMPAHQQAVVGAYIKNTPDMPPLTSFNSSGNAYPTLCALSSNVVMCLGGGCQPAGGTSASTPITAGIFSLINDMRLNKGLKPLGFVAPRIFKVAQQYPGEAFHDITEGNSKTSCSQGFPATKGWDAVTGWGDPIWNGLVKHFASD